MDLARNVFDVVDVRSFSSLWYWIVLAVLWSSVSHWVLGVPYDMILRARRKGGQAMVDLQDITRVNVTRILYIVRESGPWLLAFVAFLHSILLLLAIWYRIELAQAIAFLAVPLTLLGFLSIHTATWMEANDPEPEQMLRRLIRHRTYTQGIGMLAILCTSMYGMWHNLAVLNF
jgi:hypothetical protein